MDIAIIAAMAQNRVIGLNNQMPWHLPADLKRFKRLTMGHPIIMGRKTFEAIGRVLPGRSNIIITRNPDYQQTGCLVFNDIDSALAAACQNSETVFVIGGAELYNLFLPLANSLYLTEIQQSFAGDTFFPEINLAGWREVEREEVNDDPEVAFSYSFIKYSKLRPD
jgi:dihydrofolate reductase